MGIARFGPVVERFVLAGGLLSYIDALGYGKSSEDTFDEDEDGGVGNDRVGLGWTWASDGFVEGVDNDGPEVAPSSFVGGPWSPPLLRCIIGWWLR